MSNENIKMGYWSISAQKHIKNFKQDASHMEEFDSLNTAGKAGRLIGSLRGIGHLNNITKLEKMAGNLGIGRNELYRIILPEIERASGGEIEIIRNTAGDILGIREYVFGNNSVLEIAGNVFENLNPRNVERIAIETLDSTKKIPQLETELFQSLFKKGFKEQDIELSCVFQTYFKLVQKLARGKEAIYSNEYVWGENHDKIAYAVSQLQLNQRQTLGETIQIIQNKQGLPQEQLPPLDFNLVNLSQKIGMINPTAIVTKRNFNKNFLFSSNIIKNSIYDDDILDDVKLFIASIRFGENYTQHSRLTRTQDFIRALIEREKVGPHSANATDYTLLEQKGIIQVEHAYGNRYYMSLLRKDVASEALKIISNPEFNVKREIDPKQVNSILETGTFLSPEEIRLRMGEDPENVQEAMDHMLRVLRDETL